jgi:tryptophan 2,3-dioxygenase
MATPARPEPLSYGSYLKVADLLKCQEPESDKLGTPAHDELLFIITHQTYELWFKQIIHELDAVLRLMATDSVDERDVGRVLKHLERVVAIQRVIVQQIDILETMTPLDFLDFRDLLAPSSGFQSAQFRAIENKLGMLRAKRLAYNAQPYEAVLPQAERERAVGPESQPSLFDRVDAWLSRMPFRNFRDYDFWQAYNAQVTAMLAREEEAIRSAHAGNQAALAAQLAGLARTREEFGAVFDAARYEEARAQGQRRLSYPAFLSALMISLYRDEPILQTPFRLLTALIDIDENLSLWRYRHMLMVSRMIGARIGTGGSAGQDYLKRTVDAHRIFPDLFALSTYLLPRSTLPPLPPQVAGELGFRYAP